MALRFVPVGRPFNQLKRKGKCAGGAWRNFSGAVEMSSVNIEGKVRRRGNEYGRELAAALVLASSRGNPDRAMTRQMAQVLLDQIEPR